MYSTGATGIEPAISGLTGRRVNRYTTPPIVSEYYHRSILASMLIGVQGSGAGG